MADCKSAGIAFQGSNPCPTTIQEKPAHAGFFIVYTMTRQCLVHIRMNAAMRIGITHTHPSFVGNCAYPMNTHQDVYH